MAYIALGAVLITVCSWLTVPFTVPFTMQTFAVFCILLILGGKKGTAAICLYIALGAVGVPVFSGFGSGYAHIIGPTGGYMLGFILTGVLYMIFGGAAEKKGIFFTVLVLSGGLILCYAAGTAWFVVVYGMRGESIGFFTALALCVLPYIVPDALKMALALYVGGRITKHFPQLKD